MIKVVCACALILAYLIQLELELLIRSVTRSRSSTVERSEEIFYHASQKILYILRITLGVKILFDLPSEPIPRQTIIVSNHQSYLDIVILRAFFAHHRVRFVAKRALQQGFPAVSRLMRLQRHPFIHRHTNLLSTMRTIRTFAIGLVNTDLSPIIFPEGTCAKDGTLLPFLSAGVRQILFHLDVPITVVLIRNSYQLNTIFRLRKPIMTRPIRIGVIKYIHDPQEKKSMARHIDVLEQEYRTALQRTQ